MSDFKCTAAEPDSSAAMDILSLDVKTEIDYIKLENEELIIKQEDDDNMGMITLPTGAYEDSDHYKKHSQHHLEVIEDPAPDVSSNKWNYESNTKSYSKPNLLNNKQEDNLTPDQATYADSSEIEMLRCPECDFQTKYKSNLKIHELIHAKSSQAHMDAQNAHLLFHCLKCDFKSAQKRTLRVHEAIHADSSIYRFSCSKCDFQTKYNCSLKRHNLIHVDPSEIEMFRCTKCHFQTKHSRSLSQHQLTIHADSSEIVTEPDSTATMDILSFHVKTENDYVKLESEELIIKQEDDDNMELVALPIEADEDSDHYKKHSQHHLEVIEDPAPDRICTKWKYESNSNCYSKPHMLKNKHEDDLTTHHTDSSKIDVFSCSECDFHTKYNGSLSQHQLIHVDPSEIEMFRCTKCDYQSKHKGYLRKHLLIHADSSEIKMVRCSKCSFKTKHMKNLRQHELIHADCSQVRMFKCEQCEYQSKFKKNVQRHLLTHSNSTLFHCLKCDFKTKHKGYLRTHLLIHADSSQIEMVKCSKCSFETKYKKNMRQHELIHADCSQVRLFKCEQCDYKSKFKQNLRSHLMTHADSKSKMFHCLKCDFKTKHRRSPSKHQSIHADSSEREMLRCSKCSFETRYKN